MICPAEAGGGICADPTCDGIHLDRGEPEGELHMTMAIEVAAEDWVEYVSQMIAISDHKGQVERPKVQSAVSQAINSTAKGKGKASVGISTELGPKVAMDQALQAMLGKIGQVNRAS